jgi:hypothetical protein
MSLRRLMEAVAAKTATSMTGTVASAFYQLYDSVEGWVWACDVDTGTEQTIEDINGDEVTTTVMTGVPIATNNRDILYAQQGWPVTLQKMAGNKWSIVGLAKSKIGTNVYIFVTFDQGFGSSTRKITLGKYTRLLTYEELGVYGLYGDIAYGAVGRFNISDDSFVEIASGV